MPFCYKCGSRIEETDRFCMKCGASVDVPTASPTPSPTKPSIVKPPVQAQQPVNVQPPIATTVVTPPVAPVSQPVVQQQAATPASMDYMQQQMANKSEALKELDRMIRYFGSKQDRYDEYDRCGEKIEYFNKPRARVYVPYGKGIVFLIFGIILTVISLPLGFVSCTVTEFSRELNMVDESAVNGTVFFWGSLFVLGIAFLIISFVKKRKYRDAVNNERYNQRHINEKRFDEISAMLTTHYKNFGPCITGPSYTNPRILRALRESISSGRADSIKEAINLLHLDARNSPLDLQASMKKRADSGSGRIKKTVIFFPASAFHLR